MTDDQISDKDALNEILCKTQRLLVVHGGMKTISGQCYLSLIQRCIDEIGVELFGPSINKSVSDVKLPPKKFLFQNVYCSQCGSSFGPGDHGFSSCQGHAVVYAS